MAQTPVERALQSWVQLAVGFVETLAPKASRSRRKRASAKVKINNKGGALTAHELRERTTNRSCPEVPVIPKTAECPLQPVATGC